MTDTNRRLWLVDGSYLYKCQRSSFNFDYKKLRDHIERDGPIMQAYYLNSTRDPPLDAQNRFHTWLKCAPPKGPKLQVKLYGLKTLHGTCDACGEHYERQVQQGVDVGIATLALKLLDRYDTLILSSGDGDFMEAIEYVRNVQDKGFELVVFQGSVSTDLQSISDRIVWIDDIRTEVERDERVPATDSD